MSFLGSRQIQMTLIGLLFFAGCPDGILPDPEPDAGEEQLNCPVNSVGQCIFFNAECPPDEITSDGDEKCATCHFEEDDGLLLCGVVETARCVDQINAFGTACQTCSIRDTDEILYDDCAQRAIETNLNCEVVLLSPSSESQVDAGTGNPGADHSDPSQKCEVCSNDEGNVVTFECRPNHDACEPVVIDDRQCTECTLDGVFAYRECEPWSVDPVTCERYQNELGHCIDCYGASDELLTHQCSVAQTDTADMYCDDFLTAEGVSCRQCYDLSGNVVHESCDEEAPSAEYCQRLAYHEQTCVLCIDQSNELTFIDCIDNDCLEAQDEDCPDPDACETVYDIEGNICRICPYLDENTDMIVQEQLCLTGGNLVCEEIIELVEQERSSGGGGSGRDNIELITVEITCVVCTDGDVEVYRHCDGDTTTSPTPPICEGQVSDIGSIECQICFDANTDEEVYNDCPLCSQTTITPDIVCGICFDSSGEIEIYNDCPVCESQVSEGNIECSICRDPETDEVVSDTCPVCSQNEDILNEMCTTCTSFDDNSSVVYSDCPVCIEEESVAETTCTTCTSFDDDSSMVYSDCPVCIEEESAAETMCTTCTAANDDTVVYTNCPNCLESISLIGDTCTTCTEPENDSSIVYTNCSVCTDIELANGSTCQECKDPNTDDLTKNDCPNCESTSLLNGATCETCYAQDSGEALFTICDNDCLYTDDVFTLEDDIGDPLLLPTSEDSLAPEETTLQCTGCQTTGVDSSTAVYSNCILVVDCPTDTEETETPDAMNSPDQPQAGDGGTSTATGMDGGTDQESAVPTVPRHCEETVAMVIEGLQCSNPWGPIDADTSIAVHVMRWALMAHGVPLSYVDVTRLDLDVTCLSCSCSAGYSLAVGVPESSVELFTDLGFLIPG